MSVRCADCLLHSETNEAIKKGVMKGADVKRIPDFQEGQKK